MNSTSRQRKPLTSAHARSGLSLIEVVVSTIIIGLLMVGSLKTVGAVVRTWESTEEQFDGATLAQQLMSEVLQAEYKEDDFGTESGESSARSDFDDTDDYDDWSESPPTDKAGNEITGYTGWTREVVVQKVSPSAPTIPILDSLPDLGLRRITVTVTAPDNQQTTLVGYRSAYGAMEQSPEEASTFVTWVGADLQVGTNASKIVAGANVKNHALDQ